MKDSKRIIEFLDLHLRQHQKSQLSAIEAARLLDRAGILKNSLQKPGKPLREMLRNGLLPHAFQLGGKGSDWTIPLSQGASTVTKNPAPSQNQVPVTDENSTELKSSYFENIRSQYRPSIVKVLLVGESRPKGGTFFYKGDSKLYKHTQEVFCQLLNRKFDSTDVFLHYFCGNGYYLEDLCLEPVNHMDKGSRELVRKASVVGLAKRLRDYSPAAVVCIMKGIKPQVLQAVTKSDVHLEHKFHCVPFPSEGHESEYIWELAEVLRILGKIE